MALALFGVFLLAVFLGVPIAVSLALAAAIPLFLFTDLPLLVVVQRFFTATDSFPFMAVPFFIIAGGLLEKGGVSERLINLANSMVGGFHGGLAMVAFVASAFFGAISGSSTATVAAIGAIMVPYMLREGYSLRFSLATVASAGYLGVLIPPSIPMVTFSLSSSASVADMFLGGFVPGIGACIVMSIPAYLYGKKNIPVTRKFSWAALWAAFKDGIWALLMPLIILGGIYGGIFTPTEAAAVSCTYALIVGFLIYKELSLKKLYDILKDSAISAAMIMFIVGTAAAFGFVITREMIPMQVAEYITSLTSSPIVLLLLINLLLLFVGMFMETNAAILILAPIFLPAVTQMNIDVVAFGLIMVLNLAIGTLTPPLGVNLYVAAGLVKGSTIEDVVNGHLVWYIVVSIAILLLFSLFPSILTVIPNLL